MDPRSYNHRSKTDLAALASDLQTMTPQQRTLASVFSIGAKLMHAPIGLRAALALVTLRHGKAEGAILFADNLAKRSPGTADDLWQSVLKHMVHGKDSFDAMSAGGWNKQELDRFVGFARQLGWQEPEVALAAAAQPEEASNAGRAPGR